MSMLISCICVNPDKDGRQNDDYIKSGDLNTRCEGRELSSRCNSHSFYAICNTSSLHADLGINTSVISRVRVESSYFYSSYTIYFVTYVCFCRT